MRLMHAFVLLVAAGLAACGGRQDGQVKMKGLTPNTSLQKDARHVKASCPQCGQEIELGAEMCPDQRVCKAQLNWDESYPCGYCSGTGVCQACYLMEKEGGKCFNCQGAGYLTYRGRTPDCPDCKRTKVCTICKGSQKCDWCGGEKAVAFSVLQQKAGGKGAGEAAPPPADKSGEPKPEEPKPE